MNKNEYEKVIDIMREENKKLYNELEKEKEENKFFKSTPFKELHNSIYNLGKKSVEDKIKAKINYLKDNDIEYSEHIAILEELLEENTDE